MSEEQVRVYQGRDATTYFELFYRKKPENKQLENAICAMSKGASDKEEEKTKSLNDLKIGLNEKFYLI